MTPLSRLSSAVLAAWAASVLVAIAPVRVASAANRRPNIIFIFTDDHASHAIGAYGSKINKTPNLDRIARDGMLFQNCFCTNSICAPSRAVILTGKHSHLNGVIDNGVRFDGSQQTFPKLLQRAGYQTVMLGKWHLKTDPTGFDHWSVLIGQGPYYNPPMKTPDGIKKYTGYTTDIITTLALDWLQNQRDPGKPFMLMYQHKAPHRNWQPGPDYLHMFDGVTIPEPPTLFDDYTHRASAAREQEMTVAHHLTDGDLKLKPPNNLTPPQLARWNAAYDPRNEAFHQANLTGKDLVRWKYQRYIKDYLRCVASVDDNVGKLLDYLDESGLADNTVVVYSSDQGFYLGDHGWFDKRWMYEESLRMPLMVRWPGVTRAGSVDRHLVQNLDFAETFLDLAGVEPPADMQGRSLVPLLRGKAPADWRKSVYYHYWEFPAVHMVQRHYGVRTDRYKLIYYYLIDEWELFDLEKDPHELHSVYGDPDYADVVPELKGELERLRELYKDTKPDDRPAVRRPRRPAPRKAGLEKVFQLADARAKVPPSPDPSARPLVVGARCTPSAGNGVLVAQGGEQFGYSLYLSDRTPCFAVRSNGALKKVTGPAKLPLNKPVHLVGVLDARQRLRLYVDGKHVANVAGHFIARKPSDGLSIGADTGSPVSDYAAPVRFKGTLEDIRLYFGTMNDEGIRKWADGSE